MTDGFFGAREHVAVARLDQVGEVEQAVFLLVLRPPPLELDERRRPDLAAQHQAAKPAQLLERLIAVLLRLRIVVLADSSPSSLPCFLAAA